MHSQPTARTLSMQRLQNKPVHAKLLKLSRLVIPCYALCVRNPEIKEVFEPDPPFLGRGLASESKKRSKEHGMHGVKRQSDLLGLDQKPRFAEADPRMLMLSCKTNSAWQTWHLRGAT